VAQLASGDGWDKHHVAKNDASVPVREGREDEKIYAKAARDTGWSKIEAQDERYST
jgi:hypothetical protein